jgi:membrane associated rhomboid family serine protease
MRAGKMFAPLGTEEIIPRRRFPVMTAAIVVINSLVFLYEVFILITSGEQGLSAFVGTFGLVPAAITNDQSILSVLYLTFITSMFVHGGLLHIGFNMIYLAVFGDNVEDLMGPGLYAIFYILCGLAAALAQIASDPASKLPNVGASGAIAGVLAGYILLFPAGSVRVFIFLGFFIRIARVPALLFISLWFIIQLFGGVDSLRVTNETGGVAYLAHIGGFLAGLALAFIYKQFMKWRLS